MASVVLALSSPLSQRLATLERLALAGSRAPRVVALSRALCNQARLNLAGGYSFFRPLFAVQALPVVNDPPGVDVYRDAVETLAMGGDCANKSILLASLLIAGRPFCGPNLLRFVWEHCGSTCAADHVRLDYHDGARLTSPEWVLDALSPVSPGARSVSWAPREVWPGRWL